MIKPYRYLIYKLFSWANNGKNPAPKGTVMYILSGVHMFIGFSFLLFILAFLPTLHVTKFMQKPIIYATIAIFLIVNYWLFLRNEQWENYYSEFQLEDQSKRKKGTIAVIVYIICSALLFVLALFTYDCIRNN